MSASGKSRKSYEELVEDVMEALPVQSYTTIEDLVRKTGSSWETVWRWLLLIIRILGLPRVEVMRSPLGRGEVYKRERRRGE